MPSEVSLFYAVEMSGICQERVICFLPVLSGREPTESPDHRRSAKRDRRSRDATGVDSVGRVAWSISYQRFRMRMPELLFAPTLTITVSGDSRLIAALLSPSRDPR
jgi:hypothetical protein